MLGDLALTLASGAAGDAETASQPAVESTFGQAFEISGHRHNLRQSCLNDLKAAMASVNLKIQRC